MNALTMPETWDLVSEAYAGFALPLLSRYSALALEAAGLAAASHVIDIATGPGTLAEQAHRAGHRVKALDFSPGMIARLKARPTTEGIDAIVGDGTALPFSDGEFDAGFSMFGIFLFADRARGLAELHRVVRPGGIGVVSSWRPMSERPFLATLFSTLGELFPSADPTPALGMSTVEDCERELREAGFVDVKVIEVRDAFEAESFEDLWRWYPAACAPLALLKDRIGPDYASVDATLKERVLAAVGPGPQRLEMPGLISIGRRVL